MNHKILQIGSLTAWLLDCGGFFYDGGIIFGAVPKQAWQAYHPANAENEVLVGLHPLLVSSEDGYILVDTGVPTDARGDGYRFELPQPKHIVDALKEVGVAPEEIRQVVLTHLHPDHVGGNCWASSTELKPVFTNAAYLVQQIEAAAAAYPNERTRADYDRRELQALEQSGQLHLLAGSQVLAPGVSVQPAPGHTPGHQCLWLRSKEQVALYIGDLVVMPVQAERLAWISALDTQPMISLESKRELLGRAVAEDALLLFEHEPQAERAIGKLIAGNKHWHYQPVI